MKATPMCCDHAAVTVPRPRAQAACQASSPSTGEDKGGGEMVRTAFARALRSSMTDAERRLWSRLRKRSLGCKFRRQAPVGRYVLDFLCLEKKLVVELDGGQHADRRKDRARDSWLGEQGFSILRFWNTEVLRNVEGVVGAIRLGLETPLSPTLPRKGGGQAVGRGSR